MNATINMDILRLRLYQEALQIVRGVVKITGLSSVGGFLPSLIKAQSL
jgi:hypothetical protein